MDEAVQRLAGSWEMILPEIILIMAACAHFLIAPFLVSDRTGAPVGLRHRWGGLAMAALLAAGWLGFKTAPQTEAVSLGPFRLDDLTWFARGLSIAAGIVLLLISWNHVDDVRAAEHHACLLLIVAGLSLLAAANDLVLIYLALELVSIPTYVLLYLGRRDADGQEAVLKYFLLSIFSSAIMVFGLSLLYGVCGTTNLAAIEVVIAQGTHAQAIIPIAISAIVAGLGFRIAAVPFHFYAPDVFQGVGVAGVATLAFLPKIAGFVALLRLLGTSSGPESNLAAAAEPVVWALAALSMTVGNVLAFVQTDVRRMMAYSSIAHAGYMLVGLAAAPHAASTVGGVPALLFYLAVYGATTVGVFAVAAAVRPLNASGQSNAGSNDFAGLGRTRPAAALLMTIFLFSLTGLPPTAGFFAKLNLLLAAWSTGTSSLRVLAALMMLNAAIAATYYLRLIGVMYLQGSGDETTALRPTTGTPALVAASLCAAATIGLFIAPDWFWQAALRASG